MTQRDKRIDCRQPFCAQVLITSDPIAPHHPAQACNACNNGVYLESPILQLPDSFLYIRMSARIDECEGRPLAYMGHVRWYRTLSPSHDYPFGMGLKYMLKGRLFRDHRAWHRCDLCGENSVEDMHVTESHICLCPRCFHHVGGRDTEYIRDGMERFLMGNVV